MYKVWLNILIYQLMPSWGVAQESEESFRQTALSVLQQRLQLADPGFSGAVLKQIAQETALSEVETRRHLLALLDSLETRRQGNTAIWQEVLLVGGEMVTPKAMGKFLTQLMKKSRKVLHEEGNFSLEHILRQARKKAKLPIGGKILLVQALNLGLDTPAVGVQRDASAVDSLLAAMPATIGLLVEAYSDYGNRSIRAEAEQNPRGYPGFAFLKTSQLDTVVEKLTNVHRFIFPHLLRELALSPRIKWTVEDETFRLQPDYLLSFEANWLAFDSPNWRDSNSILIPGISATFELRHIASGVVLFRTHLMKQDAMFGSLYLPFYRSTRYNSENVSTLDGFYQEVAQQTRILLNNFLEDK